MLGIEVVLIFMAVANVSGFPDKAAGRLADVVEDVFDISGDETEGRTVGFVVLACATVIFRLSLTEEVLAGLDTALLELLFEGLIPLDELELLFAVGLPEEPDPFDEFEERVLLLELELLARDVEATLETEMERRDIIYSFS